VLFCATVNMRSCGRSAAALSAAGSAHLLN